MKKIFLTSLFSLFLMMINGQTIENVSVTPSDIEAIDVTLEVCEGYEIGYLSHTYSVVDDTINLSVCYWFTEATVVICDDRIIQIPIDPGSNNYTLNVEIYNSISQETCDYYSLTDTATLEFTTPLTQTVVLPNSENELTKLVSIYPNPASDILFFEVNNDIQILSICLFNILGSKIIEVNKPLNELSLYEVKTGVYILNIETNKGKLIKRIMKE
ncbi:MAG: T9SS type A sorting domain-containing protein [Salinivirgaceae bacterium]|nr:T9SS type A sorting domain-containing protein [Salinivirgaceae bacterium]